MSAKPETWEVVQGGIVVASATGPGAANEAMHYGLMYSKDGPVLVRLKKTKRKRK